MSEAAPKAIDLSNWMKHLAPVIGGKTLNKIVIPGCHDSAMYKGMLPADYAKTQNFDFTGQLDAGARFFDFRFDYIFGNTLKDASGSSMTPCFGNVISSDDYYMYGHSQYVVDVTLLDALTQIKSWLQRHTDEVVILKARAYDLPDRPPLWDRVKTDLGGLVYLWGEPLPQVASISMLKGKVVILGVRDDFNFGWRGCLNSIGYKADTNGIADPQLMMEYLDQVLDQARPKGLAPPSYGPLLEIQANLTPFGEVKYNPTAKIMNPQDLAKLFNPALANKLSDGWRGRALNIISVDYIDISSVAQLIVRANFDVR
jgi:hypothetical protein